jgi:hypothetical protein
VNLDYESLLGDIIDIGGGRKVFENTNDSSTVIKVLKTKKERKKTLTANEIEWNTWNKYKGSHFEQFLCPCVSISENKVYLVQKKAKMLDPGKHYKRSIEVWRNLPDEIRRLPDSRWYKNWGMFEGRYVIVDYGRNDFRRINKNSEKEILQ